MSRQAIRMDRQGRIDSLVPGDPQPHGYRRLLFLVHGFNNDELQASESFAKMRRALDTTLREAGVAESIRWSIQSTIWEFYWPGYSPVFSQRTVLSSRPFLDKLTTAAAYDAQV